MVNFHVFQFTMITFLIYVGLTIAVIGPAIHYFLDWKIKQLQKSMLAPQDIPRIFDYIIEKAKQINGVTIKDGKAYFANEKALIDFEMLLCVEIISVCVEREDYEVAAKFRDNYKYLQSRKEEIM